MSNLDFKGWLVTNGIKQQEIANLLGLSLTIVNAKLNGKSEFTVSQVRILCRHYKLDANIFL